jgi:hypothetical protein
MNVTYQLRKVWPVYFCTSSLLMGCNEFIHSYYTHRKNEQINFESYKNSIPSFIAGVIIGPTFPILYLAGFRTLEWKRCPYLK